MNGKARWSFMDKLGGVLCILSMVLTVLWLAFPTSMFIREVSMSVEGRTVTFVRETPFGDIDARWRAEITLIEGENFECMSGDWRIDTYQQKQGNTTRYDLGPWADQCLDAGPPYYLTVVRQALLFGSIPLRRDRQTTEIEGTREPDWNVETPVR